MKQRPYAALGVLLLAALVACASLYFLREPAPLWFGILLAAVSIFSFLASLVSVNIYAKRTRAALNDVFRENESAASSILNSVNIPSLLFNADGQIIWCNDAFSAEFSGHDIKKLLPGFDPEDPAQSFTFEHSGRCFQLMSVPVRRSHERAQPLTFQYWIDRTEALHYSRLYEEQMPTVALVYVDNYEELSSDLQFAKSVVLAEVERRVNALASSLGGAYRRYDNAKFFIIFEAKMLTELEKERFSLLDAVREIDTGTGQPVTLSIAVGVESRITGSDGSARQAMELALGRGGDQAVVKRGSAYSFYGGKRQLAAKQSRVKARLFSKALRQLLENSDQAFFMGHKYPDMDCLGAALGLMRCALLAGCKPYFVLDEGNNMVENVLDGMRENQLYRDCVKTPEQAEALMRPNSVVIAVDTQRLSSLAAPALYERAGKTVLIDHHRRPVDSISNPTLHYLDAAASSVCEIVAEILQYFDDNIRPTAFECGAMLAGITLDTKHFAFNTGARTFEAAAYLRKNGADNSTVKLMFQDDMRTYRSRAQVVEGALLMERGIAISACPSDMENAPLIAAQAADELISIKGIRASFVLARSEDVIMISGRSLGDINVQIVLEALGGGGHLTVAGAQLHAVTMDEAVKQLTASIFDYLKEAKVQ
ncbi:MAG: DHH family phosphoesterase [Clostridiaceae bacterium]|nr:DHH family phosphoesterase [Eubacteriales bacterium]